MLGLAARGRVVASFARLTTQPRFSQAVAPRVWMAAKEPFRRSTQVLRHAASVAAEVVPVDVRATRMLGWWLAGVSGAVFGMVAVGGYTRLTRSGLSITEWKLAGTKLPSTNDEWNAAFDKYKVTPEYLKLNMGMTLEEFKSIYFWEWFHRMWGRSLGVMFALPLAGFMAAKPTRNALKQLKLYPRLGVLFGLGGLQGLVGWWMVKSGLEHTHVLGIERDKDDMPKVSPYRLATHLSFAFVTYGLLAWTSMGLLSNSELAATEAKRLAAMSQDTLRSLGKFRTAVHATSTLMAITIVSGAFVAGNLAGLVYGDWPLMGGRFVPAGIEEEWNRFTPKVRNLFENVAMVQFDHRMLAYSTLAAGTGLLVSAQRLSSKLPAGALFRTRLVAGVLWGQATIGVATILMNVPVSLGVLHQTGALTAWTAAFWLMNSLRPIRMAVPIAAPIAATAMAAGCLFAVQDNEHDEPAEESDSEDSS